MSMIPGRHCSSPLSWQPSVVSFYKVDNFVAGEGVYADIRRYGWHQTFDGVFEPKLTFLSLKLGPRIGRVAMKRGGQQQFLEPGNVIFIPAGESFQAHCDPSELYGLIVTFVIERLSRARDVDFDTFDHEMDLRDMRVRQCLLRLAKEVAEAGFASEAVVESLTVLLMVAVFRHLSTRNAEDASGNV